MSKFSLVKLENYIIIGSQNARWPRATTFFKGQVIQPPNLNKIKHLFIFITSFYTQVLPEKHKMISNASHIQCHTNKEIYWVCWMRNVKNFYILSRTYITLLVFTTNTCMQANIHVAHHTRLQNVYYTLQLWGKLKVILWQENRISIYCMNSEY